MGGYGIITIKSEQLFRVMADRVIERLGEAIGYPDRIPSGAVEFVFRVDGMEIVAESTKDRIILKHTLTEDESMFARLAEYAA